MIKKIVFLLIIIFTYMDMKANDVVVFGGGCFWCIEAVFERLKGVENVVPGYSGGDVINPSYREVCTGTTGHAEVVEVSYNPQEISLTALLQVFFKMHDPTTLNRQGGDVGTQYRSVIFYKTDEQKLVVDKVLNELIVASVFDDPIVTQVLPLENFYLAEDYHNNYFRENGEQSYCRLVINPKIQKLEKVFEKMLK